MIRIGKLFMRFFFLKIILKKIMRNTKRYIYDFKNINLPRHLYFNSATVKRR